MMISTTCTYPLNTQHHVWAPRNIWVCFHATLQRNTGWEIKELFCLCASAQLPFALMQNVCQAANAGGCACTRVLLTKDSAAIHIFGNLLSVVSSFLLSAVLSLDRDISDILSPAPHSIFTVNMTCCKSNKYPCWDSTKMACGSSRADSSAFCDATQMNQPTGASSAVPLSRY